MPSSVSSFSVTKLRPGLQTMTVPPVIFMLPPDRPSAPPPDAELIAGADRLLAGEHDLQQLLALYRAARFVRQRRDDLPRLGIDHFSGRGIGVPAVDAKRD